MVIVAWLTADDGHAHGYAMAIVQLIKQARAQA
jgi:hypothetical protein